MQRNKNREKDYGSRSSGTIGDPALTVRKKIKNWFKIALTKRRVIILTLPVQVNFYARGKMWVKCQIQMQMKAQVVTQNSTIKNICSGKVIKMEEHPVHVMDLQLILKSYCLYAWVHSSSYNHRLKTRWILSLKCTKCRTIEWASLQVSSLETQTW